MPREEGEGVEEEEEEPPLGRQDRGHGGCIRSGN